MDSDLFHKLTADEAQILLRDFLDSEKRVLEAMDPDAAIEGVRFDYSQSSLRDVLKWMIKRARVHRMPVPEEEPSWIRQAHRDGLIEFDDDSKAIILRAANYLGECLSRLPGLRWATGHVDYLHENMPVVAGFRQDDELPFVVVVENVCARILGRGAPITTIDSTIETWKGLCPVVRS